MSKGIVQQMRESEEVKVWDKITKDDLKNVLETATVADKERRKERLKEMKNNEKFLKQRAKELNKEIPFEVAYQGFLSYDKIYVNSEFIDKYKEWL
jgi:hypothetical protein